MNKYLTMQDHMISNEIRLEEKGLYTHLTGDDWDALEELVDKATPKKLIFSEEKFDSMFDDRVQVLICPNCKRRMRYFHGVLYCPNCGQALDWSKEDE